MQFRISTAIKLIAKMKIRAHRPTILRERQCYPQNQYQVTSHLLLSHCITENATILI